jgi:hypothetical protein
LLSKKKKGADRLPSVTGNLKLFTGFYEVFYLEDTLSISLFIFLFMSRPTMRELELRGSVANHGSGPTMVFDVSP